MGLPFKRQSLPSSGTDVKLTLWIRPVIIGPLKHAGLSLSIGLAACLNASLLYWQLRKQKIFTPQPGWMAFLLRLVVAVLVMSGVLLGMLHIMPEWSLGTMPWRLLRLMAVVLAGIAAYFAALAVLGFKVKEFARLDGVTIHSGLQCRPELIFRSKSFYCRDGLLRSDRSPHTASVPDAVSTFPAPVDCVQSVLSSNQPLC